MKKAAEIYLGLASAYYIVLGLGVLVRPLYPVAVMFGIFGILIGAVPFAVFGLTGICVQIETACPAAAGYVFGPWISALGILAIIIGVIALVSLNKIGNNPKWISFWYAVSGLSIIVLLLDRGSRAVAPLELIHPALVCLSTFALRKISKSTPTAIKENQPILS